MAVRKGTPQDGQGTDQAAETGVSGADDTGDERHGDIPALAYETARDELAAIVARLESGQAGLEDSMNLWERGEALAAHCARWLDGAEARLQARADRTD